MKIVLDESKDEKRRYIHGTGLPSTPNTLRGDWAY